MSLADIDVSTLVPLAELAKELKRSAHTVRRWHTDGRWNKRASRIVKLRCLRGPCGLHSNMDLYREFIEELNSDY